MRTNITELDWEDILQYWYDKAHGLDRQHFCRFCELFFHEKGVGCVRCPLSLGRVEDLEVDMGDCWNPKHPWFAWHIHPTRKTAQALYDFIVQRHEEWKVKHA